MAGLPASTVLQWALEIEANGEAYYKAIAARTADKEAKLLFEDLAYQEERHYRTFQRMLASTPASETDDAEAAAQYQAYLRVALAGALFGGPDKGLALAQQAQDEAAALQAAIAFEKDTLVFFNDVREQVPESQRATLDAVIREENDHLHQLAKVLAAGPWVM